MRHRIAMLIACVAASALAQAPPAGGPYRIDRSTIDAGGGRSSAAQTLIEGTVGQPDAATSNGGIYQLRGGFWANAPAALPDALFANGFEPPPP